MSITALLVLLVYIAGVTLALRGEAIFALLSYFWIFYNDPQTSWWGTELPDLRYSLVAAMVALLLTWKLGKKDGAPWLGTFGMKCLFLYTAWIWIQTPWAINPAVHFEGAVLATKFLVLSYVIYRNSIESGRITWLTWAHIAGCFIFGWRAFGTESGGRLETVGGPGVDDSNALAAHIITGAVAAGMFFVALKGWRRWVALLSLPFMIDALIRTQSRGGFIALLAAGLAVWYLAPKTKRWLVTIAGAAGVCMFLMLANAEFWDRMGNLTGSAEPQKQETRLGIIGPEIQMFLDHPLGVGHRGNEYLSTQYMDPELLSNNGRRAAHNTFMAALVDQGLPGAALLLCLYLWVFFGIRKLRRLSREGLLPLEMQVNVSIIGASLASLFFSGLFLNLLKLELHVWMLSMLAALIAIANRTLANLPGQRALPKAPNARRRENCE